jgi:RNA polymerase sigma factor (sigma-70 family)
MNQDESPNYPRPLAAPAAVDVPGIDKGGSGRLITALAMRARAAWSSQDSVGEQRAFNELIGAVGGQLLVYARARLGRAKELDAEDVVAEALVAFLIQVRSDTPISNVLSLLFKILKNKLIDRLRRSNVVQNASDEELLRLQAANLAPVPAVDELAIGNMELNRILSQVPEPERVVLYLRHVHDLSVAEVAKRTGLTIDQVKKRTSQAIRHLQEVIESEQNLGA